MSKKPPPKVMQLGQIAAWNRCKSVIQKGLSDGLPLVRDMVLALKEVRDDQLYLCGGYNSFDAAGRIEFGLTRDGTKSLLHNGRLLPEHAAPQPEESPEPVVDEPHEKTDDVFEERYKKRPLPAIRPVLFAPEPEANEDRLESLRSPHNKALQSLKSLMVDIETLCVSHVGGGMSFDEIETYAGNIRRCIEDSMPWAKCPYCKRDAMCGKCGGRKWISRSVYRHLPSSLRKGANIDHPAD